MDTDLNHRGAGTRPISYESFMRYAPLAVVVAALSACSSLTPPSEEPRVREVDAGNRTLLAVGPFALHRVDGEYTGYVLHIRQEPEHLLFVLSSGGADLDNPDVGAHGAIGLPTFSTVLQGVQAVGLYNDRLTYKVPVRLSFGSGTRTAEGVVFEVPIDKDSLWILYQALHVEGFDLIYGWYENTTYTDPDAIRALTENCMRLTGEQRCNSRHFLMRLRSSSSDQTVA